MLKDVILFAVGTLVGAMNAIAGGGMLIGFPVLVALGLPPIMANASSSLIVMPGQLASAFGYRHYLRKVPRRYLWLLVPSVIGAIVGALLLRNTPPDRFKHLVPFLVLFAVLLFSYQPALHHLIKKHLHSRPKGKAVPLLLLSIGLLPVSFYGGYFGAGYGFMMLAFLSFTKIHDVHKVNGMKNVAAIFIAASALICLHGSHLVSWRYGLFMGAGATVGGYVGALSAQKISSHAMRIGVLILGVAAFIYLGIHDF